MGSAIQSLGGADYRYALKGDGQIPFTIVDGAEQRDALETALSTISPEFLALSPEIVRMIPPAAFRYSEGETFPGRTEQIFDPIAAAESLAVDGSGSTFDIGRDVRRRGALLTAAVRSKQRRIGV